jgi:type VI secretion system protein VasD
MVNRQVGMVIGVPAVLAAVLVGCGSDEKEKEKEIPEVPPTIVISELAASSDVNPNVAGTPSPIFVRVYELKAPTAFAATDFFSLWEDDGKALGKDLEDRQEVVLSPGQQSKLEREFGASSRFLGVAAAYQDLPNATWRAIQPVPPNKTTTVQIRVGRLALAVEVMKEPAKPDEQEKAPKKKGEK